MQGQSTQPGGGRRTKTTRVTQAKLRRAVEVAEDLGKRLTCRPDGMLVFEDKATGIVPSLAERCDWNRPRKDATL